MSIHPVSAIESNSAAQANAPADRPAPVVEKNPVQPISGPSPKPETHNPSNTAASSQMPEDEVQVQRDSEANGAIVIKYVDKFGHVVFQVPSSQVLGVAQAIDQELAAEAKARENAGGTQPESIGGKAHGR
jgi:hypothetical protein